MKKLSLAFFIVTLFISAASAGAQTLYGIGNTDFKQQNSDLFIIDQNTGTPTLVGDTGFPGCRGLDFNLITGELFAVCESREIGGYFLIRVDPLTGVGTFIGPLNIEEFGFVRDISFRADGTLYAYVGSKPIDFLGTINTTTGNFTKLGETGLQFNSCGMAFSLSNTLYCAATDGPLDSSLYSLSQQTGLSTFITNLNITPEPPTAIFLTSDTNPTDGTLFSIFQSEAGIFDLSTIDVSNGDVTVRGGTNGIRIDAIAFIGPRITNVPTLSEYGLILAAVVMLAAALLILRRRSNTSKV